MSSLRDGTHTTGRAGDAARRGDDRVLGVDARLAAEPAADLGRDDPDLAAVDAERRASWPCSPCGICVDAQNVSRPSASTSAAQQSGSIGTTAMRWFT